MQGHSYQIVSSSLCRNGSGCGAFPRHLTEESTADDEHGAEQARWGEHLSQEGDREHDGREGLEIAHDGNGLHGKFGYTREIEKASKSCVDEAQDRDGGPIDTSGGKGDECRCSLSKQT